MTKAPPAIKIHLAVPLQDDEDEMTFVSCEAGGDGWRLRYFLVLTSLNGKSFGETQRRKIQRVAGQVDEDLRCETEKITFGKTHVLLSVLCPPDVAIETHFQNIFALCGGSKPFLRDHYFVTNVRKPTQQEIRQYLKEIEAP